MSTKNTKKSSLLAPVIGAYEPPTQLDADRIFAKIEATLDAAPSTPPARPTAISRTGLITRLSCVALAVGAAITFRAVTHTSSPPVAPQPERGAPIADVTAAPTTHERVTTNEAPAIPSVAIDALPSLAAAPAKTPAAPKPEKPAATSSSSPRAHVPDSDTLEKEARMVAEARRASHDGDGARALALLDEHKATFPTGWLANERDAERILVLCRLDRRAEATAAATVFLEGRPKGPLTRRVEMSCAVSPDSKSAE